MSCTFTHVVKAFGVHSSSKWLTYRISDCKNALQNKTGDIIHGARAQGRPHTRLSMMLYVAGPGALAPAEPLLWLLWPLKATGFAHAFGEKTTYGSLQEATRQRTKQDRTTKSPANDCNDWRDIFAKGAGMVFSATLKSTRKPRRLETHLGARVQSDGTIFPGVRDHESLPGSTGVILAASHQLVQSMLTIWWDTWLRP